MAPSNRDRHGAELLTLTEAFYIRPLLTGVLNMYIAHLLLV